MQQTQKLELESVIVISDPEESPVEVGWTSGHVLAGALAIAYAVVLLVIALNGVIR